MGNGQRVPRDVVSVRFHPSVAKVDKNVFLGCQLLKEVVLNDCLKKIGGHGVFAGCKSLERITIPSTVTDIGDDVFAGCINLREVVLNEGLEKIGHRAFSDCKALESINLPSTVNEIGNYVFYRCSGLKNVELNEGLKKIGRGAFDGCISLESITLPSSVEEIGDYGFLGCINLREVVWCEGLPMIEPSTFENCLALERFTFPNISSRLEDIIQAGQVDVQNKIQQCLLGGIQWSRGRGEIYIPAGRYTCGSYTRRRDRWDLVQRHFCRIVKWIKYYEMKEATTIFELALWNAKMDQVEDNTDSHDRDASRIEVPGPVKDTILQYIDL